MKAQQLAARAREEAAAGRYAAANRSAWEAVQAAMLAQDERPVRDVAVVAADVAAHAEGGTREEAQKLVSYCAALLDGVGGGVKAPTLLDRLFSRRSTDAGPPPPGRTDPDLADPRVTDPDLAEVRRPCPECAESIAAEAKVCRFCGYRLDQP